MDSKAANPFVQLPAFLAPVGLHLAVPSRYSLSVSVVGDNGCHLREGAMKPWCLMFLFPPACWAGLSVRDPEHGAAATLSMSKRTRKGNTVPPCLWVTWKGDTTATLSMSEVGH